MSLLAMVLLVAARDPNPVFQGALKQLTRPAAYDPSYRRIAYPGGDVPADRGACTDVVIRALRHAGHDLQRLIHEDAGRNRYPAIARRDRNIDHRRVRNQVVFFRRHGASLSLDPASPTWKPGDFAVWVLPSGLDHIGVVSDRRGPSGHLKVIHNLSRTREEDVLARWRLVGHYRFPTRQGQ